MPTKSDLQRDITTLDDSLNPLLEALRRDGTCSLCRAGEGQQHSTSCPTWPFIWSRGVRGSAQEESAETAITLV